MRSVLNGSQNGLRNNPDTANPNIRTCNVNKFFAQRDFLFFYDIAFIRHLLTFLIDSRLYVIAWSY